MPDYPHILAKNLFEDSTISYDQTEDPIYRAWYLADRSRTSRFVGANATPQHVTFDLGSARAADCFVLDRGFVLAGEYRQLLLRRSDNGTDWTTVLTLTAAGDLADNTIPHWKTFTPVSARWWQIRMTGLTAAPIIFNVWLGLRIQPGVGPVGDYDPWDETSIDLVIEAESAATQVVHRGRRRNLIARFENLSDTRMEQIRSWWEQAGRDGKAWWYLPFPDSHAATPVEKYAPVYLASPNARRNFPIYYATRSGTLEGMEVL